LLNTIRDEAERLNRFVGNLLDMTRIEAGAMQPKLDWVGPEELAATALKRAESMIGRHRLELDVAPNLPLLRVDYVLIEQVLINLLDNAAKYSAPGSLIRLVFTPENDRLRIEVIDEGSGIPPGELEQIFDMFYRVKVGDRQVAGTGLGLSICRSILRAHGGDIHAESPVRDGHGTRMIVHLPLVAAPEAALPEDEALHG